MTGDPEPRDTLRRLGRASALGVPLVACALGAWILVQDANLRLFRAVNAWPASTGDLLWANLSVLGEGASAVALAAGLIGRRPRLLLAVLLAGLLSFVTLHSAKRLWDEPRPVRVLARGEVHVYGKPLTRNSFPSGHATTAFAAAAMAWSLSRRAAARAATLGVATSIALSRLAIGAHFPLDIVAGAALGWSCGALALRLLEPPRARKPWLDAVAATVPLLVLPVVVSPNEGEGFLIMRPAIAAFAVLTGAVGCLRAWRALRAH